MAARSSFELYMMPRTPRRIGWKIVTPSAGSRSAVGTSTARSGNRPRAMVRLSGTAAQNSSAKSKSAADCRSFEISPGLTGPWHSSQTSSSWSVCARLKTRRDRTAEVIESAFAGDWKAFDGDTVDVFGSGRKLVAPREVIAGARRQHAHLDARRQPFGNVSRVQFGAAADIGAVALNHDDDFHPSLDPSNLPASRL